MTDNQQTPAMRFRGFEYEWEKRRLDDFVDFFSGLTYTPNDVQKTGTLVLRSSNINDGKIVDADNVYVNPNIVNSENVQKGDIVMVVRNGSRSLIGKHAQLKQSMSNTVIGAFMTGIRSKCPPFTNALLNTSHFNNEVAQNMGATINQITGYMFSKMQFIVPSLEEQRNIGIFFENLDNLISLHQQKHTQLKAIKKAMLEKMFPKEGETVPEIRFAGFTGPWEQHQLNHYLFTSTEKNIAGNYSRMDVLSVSGDIGIVNQIEFQGRSFAGASVLNYGIVHTGDIVYTKSPLKSNPYGIIKTNKGKTGIVSTLYAVYQPTNETDPNFVQCYFEQDARLNNYLHPLVNKGAKNDMKVSADNALKGLVLFPVLKEQQTISSFFTHLDTLISLQQKKIDQLQHIKKAFLDKMFV